MSLEEVLLILNSLVYSSGITGKNELYGQNIYDLIQKGKIPKPGGDFFPEVEWNALMQTINNNRDYFSNIIINDVEYVKGAQKNVCITNLNTGETYVIFRGTDTNEWHDNADAGATTISDTEQQLNALEYINNLDPSYGSVIVSGHSKGGNKAQYVAILSDRVTATYSFDGQGMGPGFLIKYRDLIALNSHKITSICNRSDFVNVLFESIADKTRYTANDIDLLSALLNGDFHDVAYQHSPLSMFKIVDGELRMQTMDAEQDEFATFIGNLVIYFQSRMSEEDFAYLAHVIMHMMDKGECNVGYVSNMPEDFITRFIEHTSGFLLESKLSQKDQTIMLGLICKLFGNSVLREPIGKFGNIILDGAIMDIIKDINDKQKKVHSRNNIKRDFSQVMQAVMQENFVNSVDADITSDIFIPSYNAVKEILSGNMFEGLHQLITTNFSELIYNTIMTKEVYEKIIEDVYKEDQRMSSKIDKVLEDLQSDNSYFNV